MLILEFPYKVVQLGLKNAINKMKHMEIDHWMVSPKNAKTSNVSDLFNEEEEDAVHDGPLLSI